MFKQFVKNHPSAWRYITVSIILIIIFPVIFTVAFAGEIGVYIGAVMFLLLAMYGLYEVFSNMEMSKISAIYLSLLPLVIFLFTSENISPFSHFRGVAETNDSNSTFSSLVQHSFTWKNMLILAVASFVPMIADTKLRTSPAIAINQLIILFVVVIFSVFAKVLWIANVFSYIWLLFFVSIAVIADTFGYIGGKYLKKYIFNGAKLMPSISPKKTWAGFIMGYVFAAAFIGGVGWEMHIFRSTSNEVLFLAIASLTLPIISPAGDLAFSAIKRFLGIKDFSNLMPGHGGILDRLDAMSVVLFVIMLLFVF